MAEKKGAQVMKENRRNVQNLSRNKEYRITESKKIQLLTLSRMVCSVPVLHSRIDFATEAPVRIGETGRPFLNAQSRVELEKR